MLFGGVDVAGPVVEGWAFDTDSEGGCVIDVFVNGIKSFCFVAGNEVRADVSNYLSLQHGVVADANCGFKLEINAALSESESLVELRFNKTGDVIVGSNPFYARLPTSRVQIVSGLDGYKFYSGDRNAVIDQMSGTVTPRECDVQVWADRFCLGRTAAKAHGGEFLALVVPDKIAAVPHLLAEDMALFEGRTVRKVIDRAKRLYGIDVSYPLDVIQQAEDVRWCVTRTDSHLSWKAHHQIFKLIQNEMGLAGDLAGMSWCSTPFVHDLAAYEKSTEAEVEDIPEFGGRPEIPTIQNSVSNCVIYVNEAGVVPVVVLCGHSSCSMLSVYVRRIARLTIVVSGYSIDIGLIAAAKPNAVIYYITERNLYNSPSEISSSMSAVEWNMVARALDLGARLGAQSKFVRQAALENASELNSGNEIAADARQITEETVDALRTDGEGFNGSSDGSALPDENEAAAAQTKLH